jgi:hypothetical protein
VQIGAKVTSDKYTGEVTNIFTATRLHDWYFPELVVAAWNARVRFLLHASIRRGTTLRSGGHRITWIIPRSPSPVLLPLTCNRRRKLRQT